MVKDNQSGRIGIDLGGTKISGIVIDDQSRTRAHIRLPTPQNNYRAICQSVTNLIKDLEKASGCAGAPIGIGIPGSVSPQSALVRNANSTCLNGRDLKSDLEQSLGRPIRIANDADCFAISEATDGAGDCHHAVWGVILGTGCGSGLVLEKTLHQGALGIAGEWGHNPLPWMSESEYRSARTCWCGRIGCLETWVSGPALSTDHLHATGETLTAQEISQAAASGNTDAQATLTRHLSRLARGMAQIINMIDPDVIVIGGGLGQMKHVISTLPDAMTPYVFSDHVEINIRPPRWGDDSGVRGAARLWP